ncbi:MAG TPA: hypothetical protein VNN72_18595 [Polyangiaceae bacterium]|nr:hypothetical protein [Polyangiaceae bacterium]
MPAEEYISLRAGQGARLRKSILLVCLLALFPAARARGAELSLGSGSGAWADAGLGAIRGITIGPIESGLHPGKGYGGSAYQRTLGEVRALGGRWVSLTPFGRVADLSPTGVSLTFEQPFEENRVAVGRAIDQAHAAGLSVLLVPHLWVESGGWRGELDPGNDDDWARWAKSYREFLLAWAHVAKDHHAEMLALGVELRTWVTTAHAPSFVALAREVRALYPGLLTYASNWDDVDDSVLTGELDLIGVNAFFPLTDKEGASVAELMQGGARVAERLEAIATHWGKPILLTEFGYTTRKDPALKPWEWPDGMTHVTVDEAAQADAYVGLLAPLMEQPWLAGAFVWRLYADPQDLSQEAEWGFSPRGKLAELVLRDAFHAHWAADPPWPTGESLFRDTAELPGVY